MREAFEKWVSGRSDYFTPAEKRAAWLGYQQAAPTPPVQEDEPVYQTHLRMNQWADCSKEEYDYYVSGGVIETRVLHTHPANAKLRQAAEELLAHMYDPPNGQAPRECIENLRAALKETP